MKPSRAALAEALEAAAGGAALLYSARSARELFRLAGTYRLKGALGRLTLVCISEKVSKEAPAWAVGDIRVAKKPNEDSMFDVLEGIRRPNGPDNGMN